MVLAQYLVLAAESGAYLYAVARHALCSNVLKQDDHRTQKSIRVEMAQKKTNTVQ
jgi:hypothetical protein